MHRKQASKSKPVHVSVRMEVALRLQVEPEGDSFVVVAVGHVGLPSPREVMDALVDDDVAYQDFVISSREVFGGTLDHSGADLPESLATRREPEAEPEPPPTQAASIPWVDGEPPRDGKWYFVAYRFNGQILPSAAQWVEALGIYVDDLNNGFTSNGPILRHCPVAIEVAQ